MTAYQRVRATRNALIATAGVSALLWAGFAAGGLVLLIAATDALVALPYAARRLSETAAIVAALVAFGVVVWRTRNARRLGRVAIYLEERLPELQWTLSTAIQPGGQPTPEGMQALERAVARVRSGSVVGKRVARALGIPAALLLLGAIAMALVPDGTMERVLRPRPGDVLLRPVPKAPLGNRLSPIVVRVQPPSYTRQPARVLEDPASIAALPGSNILLRGRGAAAGLTDSLDAELVNPAGATTVRRRLPMRIVGDTWSVSFVMPDKPTMLRLDDRRYDRLLVLEPITDEVPLVLLNAPARDTIYPLPKGIMMLTAKVDDDIGLDSAYFIVMHTSGTQDRYTTKQWFIARTRFGGARGGVLRSSMGLDTMRLKPGDVLHVHAVAWDQNDVTGPGKGESETRTIRILDPRQRDTVNVNPARAAAIDTSIISQRMLIIRAESLLKQQPRITENQFISRSLQLSVKQGQLRGRVESIVYDLENVQGVGFVGTTPNSRLLRQAAVEMQGAQTELSIAQVDTALPYMKRALKLLEQARDANRYWLRGLLTTPPVEVDKIREQGPAKANLAERGPRKRSDDIRRALLLRLNRALVILGSDAQAGRDSLKMLQLESLTSAKDVAESLSQAVDAMQAGRDPHAPLVQARRRLERKTDAGDALTGWQEGGVQ